MRDYDDFSDNGMGFTLLLLSIAIRKKNRFKTQLNESVALIRIKT